MPRYTVELSNAAAKVIEAEVTSGRQPSAEAFFEELLREAQARRDHLNALIDEGFESGPAIPVTEEFWAERRRKLATAHKS
jgi:Arc/MetJ-type ribon-helix-helix transcriptional regulator